MRSSPRHHEDGFATRLATIVIVLVGAIIGVVLHVSESERRESARAVLRSEQIAIADSAVARYLVALNTGYVSRATNYQLTMAAFTSPNSPLRGYVQRGELRVFTYSPGARSFTGPTGGRDCTEPSSLVPTPAVVRREGAPGAQWQIDDGVVGATRFVVEEDHPGRPCAYWEVYRVDPLPLADLSHALSSHRHLGIVFRVWSGSTAHPRYVRTTLSRGSFSDYQLLTDDAIRFGSNVTIAGKVHSNNYGADPVAIQGPSSTTCIGDDAKVTTRTGSISIGGPKPECQPGANTGSAIDLGAMEHALRKVEGECARGPLRARCFGSLGGQGYRVEVGNPLRITNATTGAFIASISHGARPYALRFDEDRVYVRDGGGALQGGVSIFAHSDDVSHIYVEGTSFGPPTSSKAVVGLLAQGDIVVQAAVPGACGDVTINAAMLAETGTLTIPHKWRSQLRQPNTPRCGRLTVNGAIAGRTMPVLQLNWGGPDFGFSERVLTWNPMFRRVVPPMYPATGPWEMGTWREANHDCLVVNIPTADSECAL